MHPPLKSRSFRFLLAAHALTRAVVPGMLARSHGSILFTSSMAAFMGVPQVIAYSAAKSAFFGMVSTLSAELAAHGVRVNAIAPGWIFSEMSAKALDSDPARKAKVMSRIQMGRMGQPGLSLGAACTHRDHASRQSDPLVGPDRSGGAGIRTSIHRALR